MGDSNDQVRDFFAESLERAADLAAREQHLRELRFARDVQERLFPTSTPPVPGVEYGGVCRPAQQVGGDYYDFLHWSPGEMAVAVGDISGKGIPAALLMATLRAFLHGHLALVPVDIAAMMRRLNRFLFDSSEANRYATFFFARLDAVSRTLTYSNGGHNPPLLFRAGNSGAGPARLSAGGPAIGLLPDGEFVQEHVTLARGDLLIAYTDGISEATDDAGDEFGEDRLIATVERHAGDPPDAIAAQVLAAVDDFTGGAPAADDLTMVVVRIVSD